MSCRELNRLIGTAMVEPDFRQALLGGWRAEALAAFDLTSEERAVLLGIEASNLQGFARALYNWISADNGAVPLPSSMVERYLREREALGAGSP
ncbi:MAG: Os1348 family NHLP clan protein [Chloroflexia bacterium]